MSFKDLLESRVAKVNSLLCVGLDPHVKDLEDIFAKLKQGSESSDESKIYARAAFTFCENLIKETKHIAACYKPNSAFFECHGASGVQALEEVIALVPKDIPVLLDAKRGDISTTAEAYAQACFTSLKAHAVTVHPYMGFDSIEPFCKDQSKGVFVLCKTSNPSSNEFETLTTTTTTATTSVSSYAVASSSSSSSESSLQDGMKVYELVAQKCQSWHDKFGNIGLVVGATDIEAMENARKYAPSLWILAPGVGFQGGDLAKTCLAGLRSDGAGLLIPVSRGISRAANPKVAAEQFVEQINQQRSNSSSTTTRSSSESNANANGNGSSSLKRKRDEKEGDDSGVEDASSAARKLAMKERDQFFDLALRCGVLKFGTFKLKSGRESPYFFNAGMFDNGMAVSVLGDCYAGVIERSKIEFDVLFGPAYKGISLASSVVAAMYKRFGKNIPFAYNRKEEKDHGEGGVLVGASMKNKRVLIIDDVITAGTAIRESMELLAKVQAQVIGVVVALDRQERATDDVNSGSAIQAVRKDFKIEAFSVASLDDLLKFSSVHLEKVGGQQVLENIEKYREKYGVKQQLSL